MSYRAKGNRESMNYLEAAKEALFQYRKAVSTNDINDKSSEALKRGYDNNDKTTEPLDGVLKGFAVELWSDALGERFWLVADEEDAAKLRKPRGTVYTAAEAQRVIQIGDSATVAEIHDWKRRFEAIVRQVNGRVGEDR
jgi:hypothetical protein